MLLADEAGVGKTALVHQFGRSGAGSVRILEGTGDALSTRNVHLAERHAGWSGFHNAYLTIGQEETPELTRQVAN